MRIFYEHKRKAINAGKKLLQKINNQLEIIYERKANVNYYY